MRRAAWSADARTVSTASAASAMSATRRGCLSDGARAQLAARALQIVRSIDAERIGVNERHSDGEPGLERAQLLEALALLERARRQAGEALERRAAKRIDADVMVHRPGAARRARPGEVQRSAQARARRIERDDRLDDVGIGLLERILG